MGLFDFLFGTHKRHDVAKSNAKTHSYNQGYKDGYQSAHEEGISEDWDCECMDHNSYASQEDCATYFDEEFQDDDQDDYGNEYD